MIDKTFRAGEKFRPVRTESHKMQYLYDSGDSAVFMDNRDYDQIEISLARSATRCSGCCPTPRSRCSSSTNSRATSGAERDRDEGDETDPGLKGDTASGGGNKPATLESGVAVQVPLFIEEGETSGSTRAAANTSPVRRSDQRRDAVFASYQRDVTGRPLEELVAESRPLTRELAEGVDSTAKSSTTRSRPTPRAGRSSGSRRSTST